MQALLERYNLKVTPLVAYGLVVLFLVMGLLGLERFNFAQADLEARLTSRESQLARLNAIKDTDIWSDRLSTSLVLKEKTNDKLWSGSTSGVVAAQLQKTLSAISEQHDVKNLTITVDPEADDVDGIEILRFDFSGRLASGKDTIDFYGDLARYEQAIIISEMNVTNSIQTRRESYMTISGLIPISLESQNSSGAQP